MPESADVLVTGAAGYIGSRVVAELIDRGHRVSAVDNFHEGTVDAVGDVDVRELDVRDDAMADEVEAADVVMHLAAISGVEECESAQELAFDVNVGGTERVAWLCREHGTDLVFPCSMAAIGDPVELPITSDHPREPKNFYGVTKAMGEQDVDWLADDRFQAHVYLKSNLYGYHEVGGTTVGKRNVINVFVELALDGEPLTVHEPGTQSRDFIHVKDVARAYVRSLETMLEDDASGARTFPIASGDCRSVLEIAEIVQRIVAEERGDEPAIEMVENPRESETETEDFAVDTDEARETIGFEAQRTVEDTVREMVSP